MLAAASTAQAAEVTATHSHGNWTTFSFGRISHRGKLRIVLIRNENPAKIARLRNPTLGLLSSRRKRMRAGRVIARVASTTRLPYQIFVSPCFGRKLANMKFTPEKAVSLSGLSQDNSATTVRSEEHTSELQ